MTTHRFRLIKPGFVPPLDEDFCPAVLANRAFLDEVRRVGGEPLVIGLERAGGLLSRFETAVFPGDHPRAEAMLQERLGLLTAH